MRHWQSVLPLPIHELRYESLVESPETEARRLIGFLGLDWEPACLEFHRSNRAVQTPSRWQVREPIHRRSSGRWQRHADSLPAFEDRKRVVEGKSVSVRVDLGGRRIIKKKSRKQTTQHRRDLHHRTTQRTTTSTHDNITLPI